MESLNIDREYFRKVIANSCQTEFIPPLNQLLMEATRTFYEEFDYYPNLAVCAPGTFTIAGEYLEIAGGFLIQAALPFVTLIVAKWNSCLKCRIFTCSTEVDEPNKVIFPVRRCRSFRKGYPKWANLLKGVMNNFIHKNKKGFDAVIHSSIPICRGLGSSAALETAFHSLLTNIYDENADIITISNARKCKVSDEKFGESTHGSLNNYTTFFADTTKAIILDSKTESLEFFTFRDPNILFLLIMPKMNLLHHPKNLIRYRETELKLAAKFLDLVDISDVEECHLEALTSMEEPSKEKVIAILRQFEKDEDYIAEFVEQFFELPKPEIDKELSFMGEQLDYFADYEKVAIDNETIFAGESFTKFEYKTVCDEIKCFGGISNLSLRSDLTVMSKLLRRVRYILTENKRIRSMINYVTNLDFVAAGMELTRSHLSLTIDFEVSSPAMDNLIQFTAELGSGVFGSKMMRNGGTLTLLHRNSVSSTIESIKEKFGKNFYFYLTFPSGGVKKMEVIPPNVPRSYLSEPYSTVEELVKMAVKNFEATYQRHPSHGHYAPASIKVLGDHCDFNQGYTISMALNMVAVVVGALNGSGKIRVAMTANVYPQKVIFHIPSVAPLEPGKVKWASYIRGVVNYFKGSVPGFDCLIETSIPLGDQILSNAAIQIALYNFLEELTGNYTEDENEKANRCMRAEHDFTNTLCGIDDFVVALKGLENQMFLLDCKKGLFSYLPIFDSGLAFLLIYNTSGSKSSKSIKYMRLEECYDVAKALGLNSLRCAKEEDLEGLEGVSETAIKRARHIISEEKRVLAGAEALRNNDAEKFGRLMVESHISLRDNFELSSVLLDEVVNKVMEVEGVLGARMTGNEYGTSILVLVKKWAVDDAIDYVRETCEGDWKYYLLTPSGLCGKIDIKNYLNSLPGPEKTFEKIFLFKRVSLKSSLNVNLFLETGSEEITSKSAPDKVRLTTGKGKGQGERLSFFMSMKWNA